MNFIIPYQIYPFSVLFSFGDKDREVFKILKEHGIKKPGTDYKMAPDEFGITAQFDNGFTLIRMHEIPKTPEGYAVLQHEIFHGVIWLMQHVGAALNDESNENFAYVIEYLTREVYKKIMIPI